MALSQVSICVFMIVGMKYWFEKLEGKKKKKKMNKTIPDKFYNKKKVGVEEEAERPWVIISPVMAFIAHTSPKERSLHSYCSYSGSYSDTHTSKHKQRYSGSYSHTHTSKHKQS